MRDRETVEKALMEIGASNEFAACPLRHTQLLVLEVLLDIRDLLDKRPAAYQSFPKSAKPPEVKI